MELEFKNLNLEIKEINEKGIFKGIASPFGNIDLGNDRVLPSVANRNNNKTIPYLWQHKTTEPVGQVKLFSTSQGLEFEGKLYLDTNEQGIPLIPNAHKAYVLMKNKQLKNSIGYKTLDYEYVTEGKKTIRNLKDIEIMEVSGVTFPMNPRATITDVKEEGGNENMELKEKVESLEQQITSITEMLKPLQEEKTFSDKIEEFKNYIDIEIKAGKILSKANRTKIKEALETLKAMLGDDEDMQKEDEKVCKTPKKQEKENNDNIELKSDELEALKDLFNIVNKKEEDK
ncbi:HK97 family phage prohead protease [Clostridium brassicae]|uniref:HK97 family phage prohead protease n=1 Tax=Clostridium brassicae TaxID=2999072 RepID=A0ABT4D6F3_9CLOT|nr:HK97 family phage prohead protease [Clostridium brassicae]MCY6957875.1 HK97 family phage prohead protease [Clostridium brassicae]